MLRATVTCSIIPLVLAVTLYWESLSSLQKKILLWQHYLVFAKSHLPIIHLCYTLKTLRYKTIQDPTFSSTILHISFENWHTYFEYILDSTISFIRWIVAETTHDLDNLSTMIISVIYFHSHCLFLNHFYIQWVKRSSSSNSLENGLFWN